MFMRSLDSSASPPRKARGMTRKAAAARTAFWDMGEETMDRGRVEGAQRPLALGERTLASGFGGKGTGRRGHYIHPITSHHHWAPKAF